MSIKNKNFITIIFLGILLICVFNLFKEQFKNIVCQNGEIEGSDGKCTCPLVGQEYSKKLQKCICGRGKTEMEVNNKTVCI
jgi:hypothetical protein